VHLLVSSYVETDIGEPRSQETYSNTTLVELFFFFDITWSMFAIIARENKTFPHPKRTVFEAKVFLQRSQEHKNKRRMRGKRVLSRQICLPVDVSKSSKNLEFSARSENRSGLSATVNKDTPVRSSLLCVDTAHIETIGNRKRFSKIYSSFL